MSLFTKEINSEEIKNYAISHKAAKYDAGWVLEARLGRVIFDLSSFKDIDSVQFSARRVSGNGKFIVDVDENHTNFNVLSKVTQNFDLNNINVGNFGITRPIDSTGEVCVFGLTVHYNFSDEDTPLSYNWKALISRCGKYSCLRMVGDRLFANEGAYIEKASIVKSITTIPPNMYFRDGEKLKFLGTCEITHLLVDATYSIFEESKPYVHLDMPAPAMDTIVDQPMQLPAVIAQPSPNLINKSTATSVPQLASNIIYDSDVMKGLDRLKFSSLSNKSVKAINSNGKDYLLLKRGGWVPIPMSAFVTNKQYIVSITSKKLNGNGKISIGVSSGDKQPKYQSLVVENNFLDKYITLNTSGLSSADGFKLNLAMLDDGVGEVLISRILIIESVPKLTRQDVLKDLEFSREPPLVLNFNYSDKNQIKFHTKQSALIFGEQYQPMDTLKISGTIEPLSLSSKKWVAKIISTMPLLKVKDDRHVMQDFNLSSGAVDLVMGSLGQLKIADRIFVEEWNSKTQPNSNDIEILSQCHTVITPSLINLQILKKLLQNNIVYAPRMWPTARVIPRTKEPYFLYFEKYQQLTEFLIDVWQPDYPKLYVVGSTSGLPNNMQHLSEYLSYSKILEYILGAMATIDLSNNTNYASGIAALVVENSLPLITNNLHYLAQDYNIKFLNTEIIGSDVKLDKIQTRLTIEETVAQPTRFDNSFKDIYVKLLIQNLTLLFGT